MNRSASAVWRGTGRDGKGTLTTQSGVLDGAAYAFTTRFENEAGTNPEELIAAAHAGCFTMALAFALQREDLTPNELKTEAVVTLDKDGAGFINVVELRSILQNLGDVLTEEEVCSSFDLSRSLVDVL